MFKNMLQNRKNQPIRQQSGEFLLTQSDSYLSPLQKELFKQIDERFVKTFYNLFIAIKKKKRKVRQVQNVVLFQKDLNIQNLY